MKTYIDKNFKREYLKGVDLQQVGVYYNVPIRDIFKEKRAEFDYEDLENDTILLDRYSIDSGEYVENYDNIEYDYTDEVEIDDYMECFYRDYDNTMYVKGSSRSGKYLKLREYHHDKPMGHDSIIIGLTDREYEKLDNMNIDEIIDFGAESLFKVENFD